MRRLVAVGAAIAGALALSAGAAAAQPLQIRLDTVAVARGEPIWGQARIGIWALDDGQPGDMVARLHATPAHVMLAPGDYRVVVLYEGARAVRDVRIDRGGKRQRFILDLNAGEVELELLPSAGAAPVREDLTWRVHHYAPGEDSGRPVAVAVGDNPTLLLSDGWYEVQVEYDGRRVEHVVRASAGRRIWYSLVHSR